MQTKIEIGVIGEVNDSRLLRDIEWNLVRSMNQLLTYVENIGLEPEVKAELIKYIKKYPEGSLNYLAKNFRFIVNKCVEKVLANRPVVEQQKIVEEIVEKVIPIKVTESLPFRKPLFDEPPVLKDKPKWTTMSASQIQQEYHKKPVVNPAIKPAGMSSKQMAQEAEDNLERFLADDDFMDKIKNGGK